MLLTTSLLGRASNSGRDLFRSVRRAGSGSCGRRRARPDLEFLEERKLLSIDMVINSNDSGAGSLRDTIAAATPGDTIQFDMSAGNVTSPITLTSGAINISQDLDIEGPGAGLLSISGNENSTVFSVPAGVTATIAELTINHGHATDGGGVSNLGTLTLTDDELDGNSATSSAGGVYNNGTMTVTDCTFTDNTAGSVGGGMHGEGGSLTVTGCTFASNIANQRGGAIDVNDGTFAVVNSTISGNDALMEGGGINVAAANVTLTNVTVTGNHCDTSNGGHTGGGIAEFGGGGNKTLINCIVAGNYRGSGTTTPDDLRPNTASPTLSMNNLIGNAATAGNLVNGVQGNIVGNNGAGTIAISTILDTTLANNGGPTLTHALAAGSLAIDAGDNTLIPPGITTDQRGFARIVNGTVDIGAVEVQIYEASSTADSGAGSLREALTSANLAGGSIVSLTATGLITLASALPGIASDVSIVGPGAESLAVSGNGAYQVFRVQAGVTAAIAGLSIENGHSDTDGGAIENLGNLSMTGCAVSTSSADGNGGGIDNQASGTVTLIDCAVTGNSATGNGGGVENAGTFSPVDTSVAGNSAQNGGGIDNSGILTAINGTVAKNSAANNGGGIANSSGAIAALGNTIVADNTLTGGGAGPDFLGIATGDQGNNLIGDTSGGSGFVGSDLINVMAVLAPLGSYGGPTKTVALLPGSPAINAGSNALVAAGTETDQRGTGFARIVNGKVDIGAFESQGFTIAVTGGDLQSTTVGAAFAQPLEVTVASPSGEPVEGGVVTFTAPSSGSSATFPGGGRTGTATVDASGIASTVATANTISGGEYNVVAASNGATGTDLNFALTNLAGAPYRLVIHTQPSPTATAGSPFAVQPVIYLEDAFGNLEAGDSTTQITASLPGFGHGPLEGTTVVMVSNGIASFTDLADNTAETIAVMFSSGIIRGATSEPVRIAPAAASQLIIERQPSATATLRQPFMIQPVIYVADRFGNLESEDDATRVTASLSAGTGPLLGTTSVTVSGGIAVFSNLAGGGIETLALRFTSVPALNEAVSSSVVVSPAPAYQLVLHTAPSTSATAGQEFISQPVIYVEDQYGNLVTGAMPIQVTASLRVGTGPLVGTTTVNAHGGIATFSGLADDKAESIVLIFTSPSLVKAQADRTTVSPAAASRLSVSAPASATLGKPFSITVTAFDPYNNVATGYRGAVTFTSTDRQASLPARFTFGSSDNGSHTFGNGVTLRTNGLQMITARDIGNSSITGSASVQAGGASSSTSLTFAGASAGLTDLSKMVKLRGGRAIAVSSRAIGARVRAVAQADAVLDRVLGPLKDKRLAGDLARAGHA